MVPIYEQIIDQIKSAIIRGELQPDTVLPSVRSLSKELKISALTVKKAYDNLEEEGFTITVHGKGTYVAATNKNLMREEQLKEGVNTCNLQTIRYNTSGTGTTSRSDHNLL